MHKNRFIAGTGLALFLFLLCPNTSLFVQAQESVFEKEDGVYLIQSAQDMRTLALLVNGDKEVEPGVPAHNASYQLTRDIDLSAYCTGYGWTSIGIGPEEGADEKVVSAFNGTFDGGNHVVTGLYINCPGVEDVGLFGTRSYLYEGSDNAEYRDSGRTVIKNLYIKDCDITGGRNVGGVMGGMPITSGLQNGGELFIENCHVTGKITGFDSVGGITGAASVVENCSFTGTVEAYSAVGGIAGIAYYIRGCAVHASVKGGYEESGGDAGGIGGVAVCARDSYMVGAVTGTDNIGGITGRGSCLTGCYARADVTGDSYTGELLGRSQKLLDGASLPEGASGEIKIENCLTGEKDMAGFERFVEETGQEAWFCAADCAWPNLSWEKNSRFGYTAIVTVQEGDSLWALADAVYGDGHFWEQIYAQNKERIGAEPNLIRPGIDLELTLNASQADYTAKGDIRRQEEEFLARGKERGVAKAQLKGFYRRLLADDLWNGVVWDGRSRQINDFEIADLDGNGQADMLVMAGEDTVLVPGEIWLYLNDEPAYILKDEDAYYKDFFVFGLGFWDKPAMKDLDNDGSLELFFSVANGGNGGSGGRDLCLFRRVENGWEDCLRELPNDYGEDGNVGLHVSVICIAEDRYEAYCPYLDERIEFDGKNIWEIEKDKFGHTGGSNVRGFYDLQCVEYKGKNALQCREYLSGEGGNAHGVGDAVFILVWDADGVCRVADWRIEEYE